MAEFNLIDNAELLSRVAERFKALSESTRLRILLLLKQGERNVTTLTEELSVAQASVSKHLATLRQAGLVDVRYEGAQSIYFVRDQSIYDMCSIVCGGVMRQIQQEFEALGLGNPAPAKKPDAGGAGGEKPSDAQR